MSQTIAISIMGVDEIDRQHAQLIKCLDDLLAYVDGSYSFAATLTALSALLDYTRKHFADEEALLAQWGYPWLTEHTAEHAAITADVEQAWQAMEAGQDLDERIVSTLRTLIIDHINREDIQYADFHRQKTAS